MYDLYSQRHSHYSLDAFQPTFALHSSSHLSLHVTQPCPSCFVDIQLSLCPTAHNHASTSFPSIRSPGPRSSKAPWVAARLAGYRDRPLAALLQLIGRPRHLPVSSCCPCCALSMYLSHRLALPSEHLPPPSIHCCPISCHRTLHSHTASSASVNSNLYQYLFHLRSRSPTRSHTSPHRSHRQNCIRSHVQILAIPCPPRPIRLPPIT